MRRSTSKLFSFDMYILCNCTVNVCSTVLFCLSFDRLKQKKKQRPNVSDRKGKSDQQQPKVEKKADR